jgi:D-alanyl-D-alanine dipeptidase
VLAIAGAAAAAAADDRPPPGKPAPPAERAGDRAGDRPAERPDDLVDVAAIIDDAVLDLRYATADNFLGEAVYPVARCKLRRAVAARLARAARTLRGQDRRLVVWDCYRPTAIQQRMWERKPDPRYDANPRTGSKHSRAAVDVALADRGGAPIAMPTAFDDFSEAAHSKRALARGTAGAEARRLAEAMIDAGFVPLATEWWHFDAPDSANYPLSSEPL